MAADLFLEGIIFRGDAGDKSLVPDEVQGPHPVQEFFEKARLSGGSTDGAPISDDELHELLFKDDPVEVMDVRDAGTAILNKGAVRDFAWDAPVTITQTVTAPDYPIFKKHSDERFKKVVAVIERIFGNHPEECAEAMSIAKRMRDEARADVIVVASDDSLPMNKSEKSRLAAA